MLRFAQEAHDAARGPIVLVCEPPVASMSGEQPSLPRGALLADVISTHCKGIQTRRCDLADATDLAALSRRAALAVCCCGPSASTRFDSMARLMLLAPELPIILLAPADQPGVADEALRVGARDVLLCAPGYLEQLPLAVRKNLMLENARQNQEARISLLAHALQNTKQEMRALQGLADRLEALSTTDALTGLGNRRRFDERLAESLSAANRHDLPLSILSIDVDGLKTVNDTLGHEAGDDTLRLLARVLTAARRGSDVVARLGGDECAILLPHTDAASADVLAQRIIAEFARQSAPIRARLEAAARGTKGVVQVLPKRSSARTSGPQIPGLSIGIASRELGERADGKELLALADKALYDAKKSGKGRSTIALPLVKVVATKPRAAA